MNLPNLRKVFWFALAATLCGFLLSNVCLAVKGGNGGGKPGGDPPTPSAPVTYSVTPVTIPGPNPNLFGFNENSAMVGTLLNALPENRRALAYLPEISSAAFSLDDPIFNLQGLPAGWHTRSALDINNNGVIGGNIDLDETPDTTVRAMYITGATTGMPTLHTFSTPFNPTARLETVFSVNDSGDMVVRSLEERADGTRSDRVYVGNPLEGQEPADFVEIDLGAHGFPNATIDAVNLQLTNRVENSPAILVGAFRFEGADYTFRVSADGTDFELAPNYFTSDGSNIRWGSNWGTLDVNKFGDITGGAGADPAKQGKIKFNLFAGLWENGSDEILPAGGFDPFQSEWWTAALNDDGDYLLKVGQGPGDALWQGDWSPTNGELDIASLIDPNDPHKHLYAATFELTNRDANGWPTILAEGYEDLPDGSRQPYWLVLSPHAAATVSAVPEPTSVASGSSAVAFVVLHGSRRWWK